MTTKSIEAYKKLRPDDYDQFIQLAGINHSGALEAVCEMVRVKPVSSLELGVGTGLLTQRLLERFPNARVTGVDGSSEMLAIGKRKLAAFGKRFTPIVSSFEGCDWNRAAGRPYDLIVSSFALHHMDHAGYPDFFTGMLRLLRPGGQLLVADLVRTPHENLWRHYLDIWVSARVRQTNKALGLNQTKEEVWKEHERNMAEEGDNPAAVPDLLSWLGQAGYKEVEEHWRYYCIAVYGGLKDAAAASLSR